MAELVAVLCSLILGLYLSPCYHCRDSQRYSEQLFMKQLHDGRVSATFQFSTVWDVHPLHLSRLENGELWRADRHIYCIVLDGTSNCVFYCCCTS